MLLLVSKLVIAGTLLAPSFTEKGRRFLSAWRRWLLPAAVLALFSVFIYVSVAHYRFWLGNEFTAPLARDTHYFLQFLLSRLWGEYFISLALALVFLFAMLALNKKYEHRFFYDEEPYFGAVAMFLLGWPGWLYYLIALLTVFLVFNLAGTLWRGEGRFSLYYLWLSGAIVVILFLYYFRLEVPYYTLLKI